jgi:uncharacterized protein (DUF1501 family)
VESRLVSCAGPIKRRHFLSLGLAGIVNLSLPGLLRLRAAANSTTKQERTALLVVWLHGGASHLETYDPKPLAPSEYRGPYRPIRTTVPGLQLCELLPKHSTIAKRYMMLRSLVHTGPCHDSGPQQIFTGFPTTTNKLKPDHPDLFAITHSLRAHPSDVVPGYVGVSPIPYLGSAYMGPAHEAFAIYGDPNDPHFQVPNIGLKNRQEAQQLDARMNLHQRMDQLQQTRDQAEKFNAFDSFQTQAWNLVTGPQARTAFDISLEDPKVRDRYGRNTWGQRCLMARRLVEAGVDLVTATLNGPLCGRTQSWDDHAVNHHVFDAMKARAPYFDQAVTTLIEDIHERGLDRRVLVIVAGDFGRTPRISYAADSASGVKQPGRDHWPHAMSFLFSGGGIAGGQVIGSTDRRGEHVIERQVGVGDFLATLYHHLGIDAERIEIRDSTGRPVPILREGTPIPELTAGSG